MVFVVRFLFLSNFSIKILKIDACKLSDQILGSDVSGVSNKIIMRGLSSHNFVDYAFFRIPQFATIYFIRHCG